MKIVKVVCSWCIAEGFPVTPLHEIEVPDDVEGDSHGICEYHASELEEMLTLYMEYDEE
jgi:hypothetical protein